MRMSMLVAILALTLSSGGTAGAQSLYEANRDFDQQQAEMLARLQAQNAADQQAIFAAYWRQYGPALQQRFAELQASGGTVGTFEQYVWFMFTTANGTRIDEASRAQAERYAGAVAANSTVRAGGERYIEGARDNSRRTSDLADRYDRMAVRGETPVDDGQGGVTWIPGSAADQPFAYGGATYIRDGNGALYQDQGGAWAPVAPPQ